MKKILCVAAAVIFVLTCFALCGCSTDKLDKATKNADDYTIVCSFDEETKQLSATQTVKMTNRSDNSFDCVKFHIYANQYREDAQRCVVPNSYRSTAYPNGASYGEICFDNVKVDDTAVAYRIEGDDMDILSVPLSKELFPDEQITVEMTYVIKLANILHRLGYAQNTVNLGNFYPVLCHIENGNYVCSPYYNTGDPFVSDVANYTVTITAPQNYLVASSGELTSASANGNYSTYEYYGPARRDFAMVLSDKYKKISETCGNTQINYYYYNDTSPEASLATATGMFKMLCEKVGNYPYKQYTVCETDFCYGGMEYSCLSMVTSGSNSYKEAVAHETAHQWFYGLVGNDQIANAWMDEGLAEFLTHVYLDKTGEKPLQTFVLANTKTYTTYVDVLNRYYENADTSFKSLDKYKNDSEYVIMTYVKGSLLFNTLYETMGETKFFKALAKYFDQTEFCLASPQEMSQCFATVGGAETATIIDNFRLGKEIIGKVTD